MSFVKWALIGLLLLPAAEIVVFVLVAMTIGWFWAAVLFLATSVIGVYLLRRGGRADLDRFRVDVRRDGMRAIRVDGGLGPVIGGILLVFPGFITDLMGALLLVGPIRRWASATISRVLKRRQGHRDPAVVDLSPGEWHQISDRSLDKRPRTRRRSG